MKQPPRQLTPEILANPHPFFAALREAAPVQKVDALMGAYIVSRHEHIGPLLKNTAVFSSKLMGTVANMPEALGEDVLRYFRTGKNLLSVDPPLHSRLRSLVSRAFTPRRIADLEPRIRALSSELLEAMLAKDAPEFISDLAAPLPVIVIAEMLGIEPERRLDFKRWSDDVILAATSPCQEKNLARLRTSFQELHAYLEAALERRRREPGEDLITALLQANEAEGGFLSTLDLLAFVRLLLVAGNETTTKLLGNGMVALLRHPSEWERLVADASLLPNAIEEMLRFEGPAQLVVRLATEDTEVAGHSIPKGARVLLLLAAANRDPRRFPEPDRFDITRETQGHVAFGHGIHFCLGAPLARLEARVAFGELLRRVRRVSFAPGQEEHIDWGMALVVRGPRSLRPRFERR